MTLLEYIEMRLAEKHSVVFELCTDTGNMSKAKVIAVSKSCRGQILLQHGIHSRNVHYTNVETKRYAGPGCLGQWCLSAADAIIFAAQNDKPKNEISLIEKVLVPLQKQLPGSAVVNITKWPGLGDGEAIGFLDVAYSNITQQAMGYLLYADGTLGGFIQAPNDARFSRFVK